MQLYSTAGGAISGRVTGHVTARLRQRHTRWSSSKLNRSAAVRAERRRTIGLLQAEVRPCDAAVPGATLAEDETVDRVQVGSSCLPLSQLALRRRTSPMPLINPA